MIAPVELSEGWSVGVRGHCHPWASEGKGLNSLNSVLAER
jgi:hypothetical protein